MGWCLTLMSTEGSSLLWTLAAGAGRADYRRLTVALALRVIAARLLLVAYRWCYDELRQASQRAASTPRSACAVALPRRGFVPYAVSVKRCCVHLVTSGLHMSRAVHPAVLMQ